MVVVMDNELKEKLDRVKRRSWWPIAILAGILGRPKKYIYRKIDSGDFCLYEDGNFKKVYSDSVVNYYENRANG